MNTINPAPSALYRVQHEKSFTYHDRHEGFVANGQYYMDYSHWINAKKVRNHLNWNDTSDEPSPFISLFDNLGKVNSTYLARPHAPV